MVYVSDVDRTDSDTQPSDSTGPETNDHTAEVDSGKDDGSSSEQLLAQFEATLREIRYAILDVEISIDEREVD